MAVAFDGFSIREYTAKTRAVDVFKCWPFSDENEMNKKQVEALLPLISVTKFRWWSHELNKIQQQQQEQVFVVGILRNESKDEPEVEIMEAFNAQERRRGRKTDLWMPTKPKSKSPKKRSIVEIFAVSPQVDKVDDDDDDGAGEEDEFSNAQQHGDLNVVKIKHDDEQKKKKIISINKKKIKKQTLAKKLTIDQKKKKKKKKQMKKKAIKNNKGSVANKSLITCSSQGSSHKVKLSIPVNCSRKVKGSCCNNGIVNNIFDVVPMNGIKSRLKGSIQKKHGVQASKFIAKHKKSVIPVRGILKNNKELIPRQNPEIRNLVGGSQMNCCELQLSDRHVRFSGEDDILGPMKKSFSSSEQNALGTYGEVLASQSDLDHATESEKQLRIEQMNKLGDDSFSRNGTGLQTKINMTQLPGIHDPIDMLDFQRPYREKVRCISDSSSPNQIVVHNNLQIAQGYQRAQHHPTYAAVLRLPTLNEEHNIPVNTELWGNVSRASNSAEKSIDCFADHTHGFSGGDSLTRTREFAHPLPPDFASIESSNGRGSFMLQSSIKNVAGQALQQGPYCYLSPTEFMGPKWKQRVGPLSERCMNEAFCCLPLNSHGELVQVSSNGRIGFKQQNKSTLMSSSSSSSPHNSVLSRSVKDAVSEKQPIEQAIPKGQLNLLSMEKNHNVVVPARFDVSDVHLLDSERSSNNSVHILDSNLSSVNFSPNQWRQHAQSQNQKGIQTTHLKGSSDKISLKTVQPTMRLMGKDVAIGKGNIEMQAFDDGKIWMDKEIIKEHHPTSKIQGIPLLKRQTQQNKILCSALRKSKESLSHPPETVNNQASQCIMGMKVPESIFSHPYVNWKTDNVFQNGDLAIDMNATSHLHPSGHLSSPLDMPYMRANLHKSLNSGTETVNISSQLPILSASLDKHPHTGWRPAETNYQQNLPHARRLSGFDFPFLHPDCSEHIQSSYFPNSSGNQPPWLVHATIPVKTATVPPQTFTGMGGKHHNCSTSGADFLAALHHSPVASHLQSPMVSNPQLESLLGSGLFVQPPIFPFNTGTNPKFPMKVNSRKKINVSNRMKSYVSGVKVPDHYQKIKKRPAVIADDFLRPTKMRSLIQKDSNAVTETISSEIWHNAGAREPESNGYKTIDIGSGPNKAQNDKHIASQDSDTPKADGMVKSGPTKLTAGAKHILKLSHNIYEDNSRLIHSTIPSAAVTDCDSILDSQKKSTLIFRF